MALSPTGYRLARFLIGRAAPLSFALISKLVASIHSQFDFSGHGTDPVSPRSGIKKTCHWPHLSLHFWLSWIQRHG